MVDLSSLKKNAKAKNILVCGLGIEEYNKVLGCTTTNQIWYALVNAYGGTSQVRKFRVAMTFIEYETLKMKDGETVQETIT